MSSYQSNVTSAFVDLATYDALEGYLYGGDAAVTYFVRQHRKSTWFSQVPVVLSNASGTADFGNQWSVTVSRAGDYLLQTWLEVTTPVLTRVTDHKNFWVKNLMHNLVEECTITFNDLVAARFESTQLDFWSAFTVPAGKKSGYRAMTGYGVETLSPNGRDNVFLHGLSADVSHTLTLPLPFFYSRESGVALPTAALPYNDMRINFRFRPISALLTAFTGVSPHKEVAASGAATGGTYSGATALTNVRVWGNYGVVSNDERQLMGSATRDIAIEQMQAAPITKDTVGANQRFDLRFSHGIKALMFALRNRTQDIETVYDDADISGLGVGGDIFSCYDVKNSVAEGAAISAFSRTSPIDTVTLLYENTTRLGSVPSNYFTQVNPYYHAESIPSDEAGIHMYSYALDLMSVDPVGSTNYGRLTNVSIVPTNVDGIEGVNAVKASWELVVNAVSHNIVRISGGALGFPIL